jgi:regulator of replication initiation timing
LVLLIEQESEEVKRLFADIPDEERRQIQKLSFKLAELAEEKAKLQTQVVGLSQQNAHMNRENECLKQQAENQKEENNKQRRQVQAMQSKVEMYKGTMEDQNSDRLALLKEKDALMKEY